MTDEEDRQTSAAMNLRAYCALGGASLNWRKDVATLLRSGMPLDRLLRDRLADLIENVTGEGLTLSLDGIEEASSEFAWVSVRLEWMQIGHWIDERRSSGLTREVAIAAAAAEWNSSEGKCDKAYRYFQRADRWVSKAMLTESGAAFGPELLESFYHSAKQFAYFRQMNEAILSKLPVLD